MLAIVRFKLMYKEESSHFCVVVWHGSHLISCTEDWNSLARRMEHVWIQAIKKQHKGCHTLYILLNRNVIIKEAYTVYWCKNNTDKRMDGAESKRFHVQSLYVKGPVGSEIYSTSLQWYMGEHLVMAPLQGYGVIKTSITRLPLCRRSWLQLSEPSLCQLILQNCTVFTCTFRLECLSHAKSKSLACRQLHVRARISHTIVTAKRWGQSGCIGCCWLLGMPMLSLTSKSTYKRHVNITARP